MRVFPAPALVAVLSVIAASAAAQQLHYPPAARGDVVDDYFGHHVADPYRWLEDLDAPATKAWVEAENTLTFGYLAGLPQRDSIRARLTALWNYPKVGVPNREAGQIWFRKNTGLQRQSVLYRAATLGGTPQVALDPNLLSPDGSIAVAQTSPSPDGRLLGYTTAVGGSDLQDIHLRDLATGRDLPDVVQRVKFTGISWTRDGKGFYYARFKSAAQGEALREASTHHQLWYHTVGGGPDRLVFERPDDSTAFVGGGVSDDGRWLFISRRAAPPTTGCGSRISRTRCTPRWTPPRGPSSPPRTRPTAPSASWETRSICTPTGWRSGGESWRWRSATPTAHTGVPSSPRARMS